MSTRTKLWNSEKSVGDGVQRHASSLQLGCPVLDHVFPLSRPLLVHGHRIFRWPGPAVARHVGHCKAAIEAVDLDALSDVRSVTGMRRWICEGVYDSSLARMEEGTNIFKTLPMMTHGPASIFN